MATPREEIIANLGPLAALAGVWVGDKGDDLAPDDDRRGIENNKFRERMTFEPFGPTDNHEQKLWGLRYTTTAWRIGAPDPFHEEMGYWLWDPKAKQVMRCFLVPRGIALIAGGTAEANAKSFEMKAELGSPIYGICSNPFLDEEFKTVKYTCMVSCTDGETLTYDSDTWIQIKGQKELFRHRDRNTLKREKAPAKVAAQETAETF